MKIGTDCIGVGAGALIVNEKNETLLQKRTDKTRNRAGFWAKPGGGVEFGDKIEDTVIREIKEELGVDIEIIKFLLVFKLFLMDVFMEIFLYSGEYLFIYN